MLHADIDPIQIAIIVIAMVIGFIQWLWKMIKQGIEESQRTNAPMDPEEKRLRDEAWRRQVQTQQAQPPPVPRQRPTPTATPPPLNDPWSTVRDVFEKMKEEMRKAQDQPAPAAPSRPASPPHLPRSNERSAPGTTRAELPPQRPTPTSLHVPHAAAMPTPRAVHTPVAPVIPRQVAAPPLIAPPRPDFRGIRSLLLTPESLRQAILLKEILGPPKSLQSSADSAI